jgi:hypothetical protein
MLDKVSLRIHIAPAGFEIDRITLPAIQMKADRVWLMVFDNKNTDRASYFQNQIKQILRDKGIEIEIKECNIIDLYDVLKAMREIIEKEANNNIFINVASGSKIEAIAGMLTASIFQDRAKIKPYYAVPKNYGNKNEDLELKTPLSYGLKNIEYLPEYHIEQPTENQIDLLYLIGKHGGSITKKALMRQALENKLIKTTSSNNEQAGYASLNTNYITKLKRWNLIEEFHESSRSRVIKITKDGENMLKFLKPL